MRWKCRRPDHASTVAPSPLAGGGVMFVTQPRPRFSMRTIEAAPFCTSLLERVLNVQARLEESVLQEHGGDSSLRRLLTEAYEVSAGLSESPSFHGTPKAPAAPRMPSMPISSRSVRPARTRRASYTGPARARHAHTPLQPHGSTGRGLPTSPRWRFRRPPSMTTLKRRNLVARMRDDCRSCLPYFRRSFVFI